MTLRLLLQGPSQYFTKIGPTQEIIRLAPGRMGPEFRKVSITYAPVTVRRSFLYPWKADQVHESWDITARIKLRDGRTYSVSKLVGTNFDRAMEMAMMEVIKVAAIDQMQQLQTRRVS